MLLGEQLRASLKTFLASGSIEIRENGGRVNSSQPLSWEVRGSLEKPLLHLWSDNCNLTRRVLSIAAKSDDRLALAVEQFGRSKPARMEIVRLARARSPRQLSREEFSARLRRILAEQFPDETVERLSTAADLEHSLSRIYVRGISRRGKSSIAFLAVPESETPDAIESSLTFALLWFDHSRQTAAGKNLSALRLILPKGQSAAVAPRVSALDPRLNLEVCEFDDFQESLALCELRELNNVSTWLVPSREAQLLIDRASAALAPILDLAPDAIRIHPSPQFQEVLLRYLGVPFARWHDGCIFFGNDGIWEELDSRNESSLRQLLLKFKDFRSPLASDTRHPLYRAQSERWMQVNVLEDVSRIDPMLDPKHIYEQVFAQAAGRHGILDLLCITRSRRLAILELKATENIDLPLQAADYWSRIRRHQAHGDITRYGYFPGIEVQPVPPIVYIIAPALRFHPTTDSLLRHITPEMEIVRIGLSESWRRGIHVKLRKKVTK
jgi:hypothetical protein